MVSYRVTKKKPIWICLQFTFTFPWLYPTCMEFYVRITSE